MIEAKESPTGEVGENKERSEWIGGSIPQGGIEVNLSHHAQLYATLGWRVFPVHGVKKGLISSYCDCGKTNCDTPGKHPHIKGWQNFATTDPAQIAEWWKKWPNANIGVVAGQESGIVVIDIDDPETTELDGKELPSTLSQTTGSGGTHLVYQHPGFKVKSVTKVFPKIDSRADGGFFIAPPSAHVSGNSYEWNASPFKTDIAPCPQWWIEAVNKKVEKETKTTGDGTFKPIEEGERNTRLASIAGGVWNYIPDPEILEMTLNAVNAKHAPKPVENTEIAQIVESISKYPTKDIPSQVVEGKKIADELLKNLPRKRQTLTAKELDAMEFPELNYLYPDLLPEEGFCILASAPKIGKSWLTLGLAIALTSLVLFLGLLLPKRKVLYFALEDGQRRIQKRSRLIGYTPNEELIFSFGWAEDKTPPDVFLRRLIEENGNPKVVVIDDIRSATPSRIKEESKDFGDYWRPVQKLALELGVLIIGVFHTRKQVDEDHFLMISGSTSFFGIADVALVLERQRGTTQANLHATGREIKEKTWKLEREGYRWAMLGESMKVAKTPERQDILDYITANPGQTQTKIAEGMNKSLNTLKTLLAKMVKEGNIENISGSGYFIAGFGLEDEPKSTVTINPINSINYYQPVSTGVTQEKESEVLEPVDGLHGLQQLTGFIDVAGDYHPEQPTDLCPKCGAKILNGFFCECEGEGRNLIF